MVQLFTSIAIASFLFGGTTVSPVATAELQSAEESFFAAAHIPKSYTIKLTGYNAVPEQTDSDPFVTASGLFSNTEIIVAKSRDLDLPFGTVIAIDASNRERNNSCGVELVEDMIGYRVVGDVTHARKSMQIDVLLNEHKPINLNGDYINPSLVLGICDGVKIKVVGMIDDLRNVPDTQEELRKMIES